MIAPLMLAILGPAKMGPILPPLSSAQFQDTVRAVESSLEAHDFVKAKNLAELLPKREIVLSWDDRKVPPAQRPAFQEAFQKASRSWSALKVTVKTTGADIRIAPEEKLADDPKSGNPANVVTFFSDAPGQPRLDARIALHRGKSGREATAEDIQNDVRFAIGAYLGISSHNLPSFAMYGDSDTNNLRLIGKPENRASGRNLDLADLLRKAVVAKTPVGLSGTPKVSMQPTSFEGEANQGELVDLPVTVKSEGSGTVAVEADGDCGCIVPEGAAPIAPGMTETLGLTLQTAEYSRAIERNVIVYTNDPGMPSVVIPVRVNVIPRYRFIIPDGATFTVDESGKKFNVFLVFPDDMDMKVTHVRTVGIDGATATFEPWQGTIADPDRNEGPKPRHGYEIHLSIPGKLPTPRSLLSLAIVTTTPGFIVLYQDIYAQQGIVVFPGELFFGELGTASKTASLVINRPGKPFEIASVTPSAGYFSAVAQRGSGPDEYKIVVKYDGKAPLGDLQDKLVINTNDPKQPTITIPITGSVR